MSSLFAFASLCQPYQGRKSWQIATREPTKKRTVTHRALRISVPIWPIYGSSNPLQQTKSLQKICRAALRDPSLQDIFRNRAERSPYLEPTIGVSIPMETFSFLSEQLCGSRTRKNRFFFSIPPLYAPLFLIRGTWTSGYTLIIPDPSISGVKLMDALNSEDLKFSSLQIRA